MYTGGMNGLDNYDKEDRPWGGFERFTLNEPSTVKIIMVSPGEAFSLQQHTRRTEFWRVLKGSGKVTIGEDERKAAEGDMFRVAEGEKHRAEAGPEGLTLLEIAFGTFDENDIARLEDKYGRA